MQLIDGSWIYSASDLNNDLECKHLTQLERRVALGGGGLKRPQPDATSELLSVKGEEHEQRYLERLRGHYGDDLATFPNRVGNTLAAMREAEAETLAAMERGVRLIYQATFFDGTFLGRSDFLRRIEKPSAKWPWSYEVLDTKLALNPKPYFLIQLCNYSAHVERLQGGAPEYGYIVLGTGVERRFRLAEYAAYYRHQRANFLARSQLTIATYPNECAHCAICRWDEVCAAQRDADDHLGLVAFMRSDQIDKLATKNITTIARLAGSAREDRPHRMSEKTFLGLRAQAQLQHKQRQALSNGHASSPYFYDFVDHEEKKGFEAVPAPDEGDVFFDMEGDPLYSPDHPLEYLFGLYLPKEDEYCAVWARSDREERKAFENVVDFLVERRARYPRMHVYHYAAYEKSALRRLSGHYASRGSDIDQFLKDQVFIDLYNVVRQSLRISQEKYSIKMLEPFYGMERKTEVRRGDDSIVMFEAWLSSKEESILEDIERYNEDDCRSTYLLRQWLLEKRGELADRLRRDIPWRPEPEGTDEQKYAQSDLERALLEGVPAPLSLGDFRQMDQGLRVRWLLAHLLEYHRRENKSAWWKLFDRYEHTDQLVEFDDEAIGDLRLREDIAAVKLSPRQLPIYTYEFPEQEHHLGKADPYCPYARTRAGELVEIDDDRRLVRLKVARKIEPAQLRALIPGEPLRHDAQRQSLERLAQLQLDRALAAQFPAVFDLLAGGAPRLSGVPAGAPVQPVDVTSTAISAIVQRLDSSYLFVQGPPGSGKSTKGAAVIVDLLAAKRRVGIMAGSHRAIHNLLHKVEEEAARRGDRFAGLYKHSQTDESEFRSKLTAPMILSVPDNDAFEMQPHDLAAGTSWLFARKELTQRYDYLFIDEAGQVAIGDAVACAPSAHNVVLLGDPLQLPQVAQGAHPVGTDLSILEHLLGDDETVRPERGVFLDVSYRMHPEICKFVSEAVYEARLEAASGTSANEVRSPGLAGHGLRYFPVEHRGNSRESAEEAGVLVRELTLLLQGRLQVSGQPSRALTQNDVLVVTPYNRQRQRLERAFAAAGFPDVRVGTVDKFQGQEAAVVFYSMATSSGDDLPRDVGFLFQKNRLNVAISRAQCMTILLCSPRLLDVSCSTPEQMALVNLLCAFVEHSTKDKAMA